MSIQFNCPHCDLPLTVADHFSGTMSNCLRCEEAIIVPGSLPLLRLHLPIIHIVVMGASVIGIVLYILLLPFLIKLRTMFVLREEGYACSLWRNGMKQFSGRNANRPLENHRYVKKIFL